MGSEWQVCEIEETVNHGFDQFTVSAVPQFWIIRLKNGSLMCFWPKKNAAVKIRSQQPPEASKGTYYKCRILFNGAKFSSYKKAKYAEIEAQNFSVMEGAMDEDKLNSTMNFDVSDDVPESDVEMATDTGCIDHDHNENEIIGNDSSDYNSAMLRKPFVLVDSEKNLPNVHTLPGYNALFNSNNEFLTSTALDESECSFKIDGMENLDNVNKDGSVDVRHNNLIMSKISSIEEKCCSFLQFIKKELNEVKEMVTGRAAERDHGLDRPPNHVIPNVIVYNESHVSTELDIRDDASERDIIKTPIAFLPTDMPVETRHDGPTNEMYSKEIWSTTLNETFIAPSENAQLSIEVPNFTCGEIAIGRNCDAEKTFTIACLPVNGDDSLDRKNVSQNNLLNNQQDPQLHAEIQEISTDGNNEHPIPMNLVLPVNTIEQYEDNEDVLAIDDEWKAYLTGRMKPLQDEDETEYMNRTTFVAFTKHFLLNHLAWKAAAGRVNIKNGNHLCCWKDSYEKEFGTDVQNQRIQYHIRRLKSTTRAADKRERKRKDLQKCRKVTVMKPSGSYRPK